MQMGLHLSKLSARHVAAAGRETTGGARGVTFPRPRFHSSPGHELGCAPLMLPPPCPTPLVASLFPSPPLACCAARVPASNLPGPSPDSWRSCFPLSPLALRFHRTCLCHGGGAALRSRCPNHCDDGCRSRIRRVGRDGNFGHVGLGLG